MKKNNLSPVYIVIKKIYRSRFKYFYSLNENGYSVAISLNNKDLNNIKRRQFFALIKKEKININLGKIENPVIKTKPRSNLFMSLYKKMIVNKYGLSR
jgi:hypothetical protein